MNQFKPGDRVYSDGGQAANYIGPHMDSHIVAPLLMSGDGFEDQEEAEPFEDRPTTWKRVHAKPPIYLIDADMAALQERANALSATVHELSTTKRNLEEERRKATDEIAQVDDLRYIADIIAGRMEWVLVKDYNKFEIKPFKEVFAKDSGAKFQLLDIEFSYYKREVDMLGRRGNGDSSHRTWLFKTEQECKDHLQKMYDHGVALLKKEPARSSYNYEWMHSSPPPDYIQEDPWMVEHRRTKHLGYARSAVEQAEKALATARASLAAQEAKTP